MAQINIESVMEYLQRHGFNQADQEKVKEAIEANLPKETYNKAIAFLGWATVILVSGSILLSVMDKAPEAIWGAIGAGIGGLAGIFTGTK